MKEEKKGFLASKTNWFGIVLFLVSLAEFLQGNSFIQQFPQITAGVGMLSGVFVVVLRLMTKAGIKGVSE